MRYSNFETLLCKVKQSDNTSLNSKNFSGLVFLRLNFRFLRFFNFLILRSIRSFHSPTEINLPEIHPATHKPGYPRFFSFKPLAFSPPRRASLIPNFPTNPVGYQLLPSFSFYLRIPFARNFGNRSNGVSRSSPLISSFVTVSLSLSFPPFANRTRTRQ